MEKISPEAAFMDIRAWIKKRVQDYEEEPRTGVPRGEELPIPKHKYHAGLLMLVYGSQEYSDLHKIAKEAGSKYSLLGKWRVEKRFQLITEKAAKNFLDDWLELFSWTCDKLSQTKDKKDRARYNHFLDRMLDFAQYTWGTILRDQFFSRAEKLLSRQDLPIKGYFGLHQLLTVFLWPYLSKKKREMTLPLRRDLYQHSIDELKKRGLKAAETGETETVKEIIAHMAEMLTLANNRMWAPTPGKIVNKGI